MNDLKNELESVAKIIRKIIKDLYDSGYISTFKDIKGFYPYLPGVLVYYITKPNTTEFICIPYYALESIQSANEYIDKLLIKKREEEEARERAESLKRFDEDMKEFYRLKSKLKL